MLDFFSLTARTGERFCFGQKIPYWLEYYMHLQTVAQQYVRTYLRYVEVLG